jgi:hypothetical protein
MAAIDEAAEPQGNKRGQDRIARSDYPEPDHRQVEFDDPVTGGDARDGHHRLHGDAACEQREKQAVVDVGAPHRSGQTAENEGRRM